MSRDTSFYYSFLVLPPSKRKAIIAVWDFCRAVDDAVDETVPEHALGDSIPDGARERAALQLARWRAELACCFDNSMSPATPQGRALQPYIGGFSLPRTPFEDLIDGVQMDLQHARYQTFEALSE